MHLSKNNCFEKQTRENSWPKKVRQSWRDLECVISTSKRRVLTQKSHTLTKEFIVWISYVEPKRNFANINISLVTDFNKKFWKTVQLPFSDKVFHNEAINLIKKKTILSDDQIVAETFNNYFNNIVKNLLTLTNKK